MSAVLYRCGAPTDQVCACGRVARDLAGRGVEHRTVRVGMRRTGREEVVALTGQDRVPVLVLDGAAICDGRRIREHLQWRSEQDAA